MRDRTGQSANASSLIMLSYQALYLSISAVNNSPPKEAGACSCPVVNGRSFLPFVAFHF